MAAGSLDSSEALYAAVDYVRSLYCAERARYEARAGRKTNYGNEPIPKWDGGVDSNGRTYKSVWPKVLQFCIEHSLDPAVLVRAVFAISTSAPPTPNMLYSQRAIAAYNKFPQHTERVVINALRFSSRQAEIYYNIFKDWYQEDEETTWRLVIQLDPPQLTTLYRYCLAAQCEFDDLIGKYQLPALHEYMWARKTYDEIWSDWIPDILREDCDRLTREMMNEFKDEEER